MRLSDNPRAKEALQQYLPQSLMSAQLPFRSLAEQDPQLMQLLQQLRSAVGISDAVFGGVDSRRGSLGPQPPMFGGGMGAGHGGLASGAGGGGNVGYGFHAGYRH